MFSNLKGHVAEFIRGKDCFVVPFHESLHGDEIEQNTLFGGFMSLACKIYVIYIGVTEGLRMMNFTNPSIISQEVTFTNIDEHILLNKTSKQLVEIWEGGDDNPERTVALDHDSR